MTSASATFTSCLQGIWNPSSGWSYGLNGTEVVSLYACDGGNGSPPATSIELGDPITSVGENAFYNRDAIISISFGSTVTNISSNAFTEMSSLVNFTLGSGLQSIGFNILGNTPGVTTLTIPASVTSIADGAFADASGLVSINVDPANPYFSSENGVLFDKNKTILLSYPQSKTGSSYVVPSSVETITAFAFGGYSYQSVSPLISLTLPSTLKAIGNRAFANTSNLRNVNIPSGLTSFGTGVFSNAAAVTSIAIPSIVTAIQEGEFASNYALQSISIPNSVTSIGAFAFYDCPSLTSITIGAAVETIGEIAFEGDFSLREFIVDPANAHYSSLNGVLYSDNRSTLVAFPAKNPMTTLELPSTVTSINQNAFYSGNLLTGFVVPIGNASFSVANNSLIENSTHTLITYAKGRGDRSYATPNGVTRFGYSAFTYSQNIETLTISNDVTNVDGSFQGARNLSNVTIGSGIASQDRFYFMEYLTETVTSVSIAEGTTTIGTNLLSDYGERSRIQTLIIPNSVTRIKSRSFYHQSRITNLTLGESVATIEQRAFQGLISLTRLDIPNSVNEIGTQAFMGAIALTDLVFGESVATVGDSAFSGLTSLTDLVISNSVTTIGDQAFSGLTSLTTLVIGNSVESIGGSAFAYSELLTSVVIPNSVKIIGYGAFDGSGITSLTINRDLERLDPVAFNLISNQYSFTYCGSIDDQTLVEAGLNLNNRAQCPATPAFTLSSNNISGGTGSAISGYSIMTSAGAGEVNQYSISPALRNGTLAINSRTGILSGVPAASLETTTFTVIGANAFGEASTTFTLTIIGSSQSQGSQNNQNNSSGSVTLQPVVSRDVLIATSRTQLIQKIASKKPVSTLEMLASDLIVRSEAILARTNAQLQKLQSNSPNQTLTFEVVRLTLLRASVVEQAVTPTTQPPLRTSDLVAAGFLEGTNPNKTLILIQLKKLPVAKVDSIEKIESSIKAVEASIKARKEKLAKLKNRGR